MSTERDPLRDKQTREHLNEALDDPRGLGRLMDEEEEPTIRERLAEASRMGQEPKDRMWAVIIVVSILVFLLGGLVLETRFYLSEGRTLGFQRGAVDCLTVLVDSDRDFGLPDYCEDPRLVVYYPDSVCDLYYTDINACGAKEDG